MATRTVAVDELTARVAGVFAKLGLPDEDARIVADHLVEADLRGVHSHGVIRVPTYVHEFRTGESPDAHLIGTQVPPYARAGPKGSTPYTASLG